MAALYWMFIDSAVLCYAAYVILCAIALTALSAATAHCRSHIMR